MHKFNNSLSLERLREVLHYEPSTGVFTWIKALPRFLGKRAGCINAHPTQGYMVVRIDGKLYRASRLAWFYVTGEWPVYLIDHIDGRRDHDAFDNLREATSGQNNANKHSLVGESGFKGVYRNSRNRFAARLVLQRRSIYLGTYKTPIEAAAAYNIGAIQHFGAFAQLNQL